MFEGEVAIYSYYQNVSRL